MSEPLLLYVKFSLFENPTYNSKSFQACEQLDFETSKEGTEFPLIGNAFGVVVVYNSQVIGSIINLFENE